MDFQALQSTLTEARSGPSSSKPVSFYERYELVEEIGKGAYGTVWKCHRRLDPMQCPYGVKIINKKQAGSRGLKEVMGEVETMSLLVHPNIVRLEETFQDEEHLWIVMEYMPGGELRTAIIRDGSFSETKARRITTQLLLALEFIHQKGIVHRDLKPENCLLSGGDLVCKISDFGFSVLVWSDQCLMSFCGTTVFMAPEIFCEASYGRPVDMWALGVMVYLMVTGEYPFTGRNQKSITEAICNARCNLKTGKIAETSSNLRDFISKLLVADPTRRLSAREALKQPWIKIGMSMEDSTVEEMDSEKCGLRPRSIFRAAVIALMAAHRLCYLRYCRMLEHSGCGACTVLHNFRFAVSGVYEPPNPTLDCSGVFAKHPCGVSFLLPMVEASRTIETLDLSSNNIDSLAVFQQLAKTVSQHPTLLSLNLSCNPVPALAGRSLLRIARSPQSKLQHLGLDGAFISSETLSQISAALKDKSGASSSPAFTPQLTPTTRSLDSNSSTCLKTVYASTSRQKYGRVHSSFPQPRSLKVSAPRLPPISPAKR
ncbi:putative protein kinase [Trypanosoma rangeli]|uniref:Protein kinase domain-containing protein n=1 Tax=Trypanosoma rangeli TaxID=5698 RepID=A0A3R7MKJ1_TRYRA|nr:putative protein kinase [Trypanosoma rangeli]RNF04157.1 putative protein kinase [Trypanosoma rangeli]|eukprot:RNF04157.1 putative protein kinase [Trypanosoma rangeli]